MRFTNVQNNKRDLKEQNFIMYKRVFRYFKSLQQSRHQLLILTLLSILLVIHSCKKEDEVSADPSFKLTFSTDTLFYDTVFTQSGGNGPLSVTKQLWVSNKNSQAVKSNIRLSGNFPGVFILNIDGKPSTGAMGKEIRGNDSIMIFVQIYIPEGGSSLPFIINDQLIFETNGNVQEVQLIGWGQDANYFKNEVLEGSGGHLVWTAEKPYVIYDSILVPAGLTLTIKAGARIHSHNNSVILVLGTLIVEGEKEKPVIFEGTRTDLDYRTRTGQWIGIRFLPRSKDNVIRHSIIRNGILGIEVDSLPVNNNPNLLLRETKIDNMLAAGLVAYSANIVAINNVISNCGQFTFYGALGGDYTLYHNTFAAYNIGFNRQNPHFLLDNSPFKNASGAVILTVPLNYRLVNNVIYGSREEELLLNNAADGNQTFTTRIIQNNLFRTTIQALQTNDNILNKDPRFEDITNNDFRIKPDSPAKNKGISIGVLTDIYENVRSSGTPSIGAWE